MHRLFILVLLLFLFDAVEGRHGALNRTFFTELIHILLLNDFLLVRKAHRFALFRTVFNLLTDHLEKLICISNIAIKLLTIDRNTWMVMEIHLHSLLIVTIQKQSFVVITRQLHIRHLFKITSMVPLEIIFGVNLRDLDSFVEA